MLMPGRNEPWPPVQGIQQRSSECIGRNGRRMLCMHAATGCETTSAVYRKCKRLPFLDDHLDVKRHERAKFDLATLPPTSAAARQNSFRVYHQVQQWRGVALDPIDWGWKLKDGHLKRLHHSLHSENQHPIHYSTSCRAITDRDVSAIASVGEAAFHAHRCVDYVRDVVASTTIRAMTQVMEKTIRVVVVQCVLFISMNMSTYAQYNFTHTYSQSNHKIPLRHSPWAAITVFHVECIM